MKRQKIDEYTGERTCKECGQWYTPGDWHFSLSYCKDCLKKINAKVEDRNV